MELREIGLDAELVDKSDNLKDINIWTKRKLKFRQHDLYAVTPLRRQNPCKEETMFSFRIDVDGARVYRKLG